MAYTNFSSLIFYEPVDFLTSAFLKCRWKPYRALGATLESFREDSKKKYIYFEAAFPRCKQRWMS